MACKVTRLILKTCSFCRDAWHSSTASLLCFTRFPCSRLCLSKHGTDFFPFSGLRMGGVWGQWKKIYIKAFPKPVWKFRGPPVKRWGSSHQDGLSRLSGLWLCLQCEQPRGAFRNACLTNILLTFADSLLHCLFFLVPWMCWFLSLLLGLCPRHCIISVFVFGSCVGGRYLHLDTNVNVIHMQLNYSNEIQGSEHPWHGREGRDTLLLGRAIPSITAWNFAPPPAFGLAASSSPAPPNCFAQWI